MAHFDEHMALAFDPFAGDFGDQGDKTLRDKIVTARKSGECTECQQPIHAGMRIRSRTDRMDETLMSYRWCQPCCEAMAISWKDDGEAIEARFRLRKDRINP